jgi:predicted DCC family thiol-disulfide oxidoreductase YuxK
LADDTRSSLPEGWILYDGLCGVCSRWVPRWADTLKRQGLAIETLQADWVIERLGLPSAELTRDIRLLLQNGEQRQGADVYRYVMRRIWWAKPLYVITVLPIFSAVFDLAYRAFADNRFWISHTCRMPVPPDSTDRSTT